ncbi:MAG: sugar phosphate isomerase/epimerase [Nitrososphaerota archaeon]|nr:sugar phosphate isomerase/epimerase [Candidatus Calditenuaceae archaeon]MDW8073690.1 sugar phosphate isomerase/epimerase [Nitrososphaerota archaeon]
MGIALQLYSVRDDCSKDFFKTLEAVARMGYEGVEFAGYYGKSAGEIRDKLRELGLKIAGAHESIQRMSGEQLESTLKFNTELGNKTVVVPWLPLEMRSDRQGWINCAKMISDVAEKASRLGFRVGYHNHREEFTPINGEYPWHIFFNNTSSSVFMQLDTGNALSAGIPASMLVDVIKKYANRSLTIHLKDYSTKRGFVLLGEGDVPFRDVLTACSDFGGTEWLIVELETYPYSPLESVKRCLENLRKIL